jgi:hypothetical protein
MLVVGAQEQLSKRFECRTGRRQDRASRGGGLGLTSHCQGARARAVISCRRPSTSPTAALAPLAQKPCPEPCPLNENDPLSGAASA